MKLSLITRVALVAATLGWASAASADLFVGNVNFVADEDLQQDDRLYFELDHVSWDGVPFQPQTPTIFALDADFDGLLKAQLVLIQGSDYGQTVASSFPTLEDDAGFTVATLGSEGLAPDLSLAMNGWEDSERALVGWIIANSSEFIGLAVQSGQLSDEAADQWQTNARAFEQYLRRAEGPLKRMVTIASDKELEARNLTLGYLSQLVQPALKNLGFYEGEIDGIWGGQTASAVRAYQIALGSLPTSYLSLDQIGQLQQAYGAGLTTQAALITPWASSIERTSAAYETALSEIESLKVALASQKSMSADVSNAYQNALENLEASQRVNGELEEKLGTLSAQNDQNNQRAEQLEGRVAELSAQIGDATANQEQSADLNVKIDTLSQDLAAREAELAASVEANAALKASLQQTTASDDGHLDRISELEALVASLTAELEGTAEQTTQAVQLEAQVSVLKSELVEKLEKIATLSAVESQLDDMSAQLSAKSDENAALVLELNETKAALVEATRPPEVDPAELLAKLQESSETIASLNAQLESADEESSIPLQRFTSVRDSLTQRVSMLNNMIVEERDNTSEYRNKWFAAQAELEELQNACREQPACADALRLN